LIVNRLLAGTTIDLLMRDSLALVATVRST
jgi:hypothetical protein